MNAIEQDANLALAVQPHDLLAYLRANGWSELRAIADGAGAIWQRRLEGRMRQILLPLDSSYADYTDRLQEALDRLAAAERRSPIAIMADITAASSDSVRIRAARPTTADGTIAIDEGLRLIERARDLLAAAACAAVQPRRSFYNARPREAADYMRRQVRLGQTERGSYVITLISRLPPTLALFPLDFEPFERKAMRTLARALIATEQASRRALVESSILYFEDAIAAGFSANLADALVGLQEAAESAVQFTFSWARSHPAYGDIPSQTSITPEMIPVIREAGRIFRETAAQEDTEVRGIVIALSRPEPAAVGKVTVATADDDPPRRVSVELDDAAYRLAGEAHFNRTSVVCHGRLARDGRTYVLLDPHGFSLEPDA